MKKFITILLAAIMLFSLVACTQQKTLDGKLSDYVDQMYKDEALTEDTKTAFGYFQTFDITSEETESFLGVKTEILEGVASEPLMSSQAYSLVLIRVADGTDIAKLKADIKANAPINKWVCVCVEPDQVYVENIGNVIMLLMCAWEGDNDVLHQAFLNLGK